LLIDSGHTLTASLNASTQSVPVTIAGSDVQGENFTLCECRIVAFRSAKVALLSRSERRQPFSRRAKKRLRYSVQRSEIFSLDGSPAPRSTQRGRKSY
jgi:hypothetical protein